MIHPLNGLQLDEFANERYKRMIGEAQRDLRAWRVSKTRANTHFNWLRSLGNDLRASLGAKMRTNYGEDSKR